MKMKLQELLIQTVKVNKNIQIENLQTSSVYKTWEGDGPKNIFSNVGDGDLSPNFEFSKHIVFNFSYVWLSEKTFLLT